MVKSATEMYTVNTPMLVTSTREDSTHLSKGRRWLISVRSVATSSYLSLWCGTGRTSHKYVHALAM